MPTPAKKPAPERGPRLQVYARPYVPRDRRACIGPKCMGKKTFLSEGPHNRVCPDCRTLNAARVRSHSPLAFAPAADVPVGVE